MANMLLVRTAGPIVSGVHRFTAMYHLLAMGFNFQLGERHVPRVWLC